MTTPLARDAELAADIVHSAGSLALRMRTDGLTSLRKTSVSDIVTAADQAAEDLVASRLREQRPADGIVGEEGAAVESTSGRTWFIDPVDGTYNFFHGLGHWNCALALVDADGPVIGAVYQPESDELWVGGRGVPLTRNGEPVPPIEDRPLSLAGAATYLHPTYFADPLVAGPWQAVSSRVATLRMLGAGSSDLAAIASGRLHLWYQHSTQDWDWYPGRALVEAAGGHTEIVEVNRTRWHVAGAPTAVAEAVAALQGPPGPVAAS